MIKQGYNDYIGVDLNIEIWCNEYFNINQNNKDNGKQSKSLVGKR